MTFFYSVLLLLKPCAQQLKVRKKLPSQQFVLQRLQAWEQHPRTPHTHFFNLQTDFSKRTKQPPEQPIITMVKRIATNGYQTNECPAPTASTTPRILSFTSVTAAQIQKTKPKTTRTQKI